MSLLKTRAEKAVDEILIGMEKGIQTMLQVHRAGFRRVWEDQVLTPDQIIARMGPRAAGIMGTSWGLVQLLLSVDPNILQPAQYMPRRELQFHEDGTVTFAEPPEGYDAWGRPIPPPPDQGGEGGGE